MSYNNQGYQQQGGYQQQQGGYGQQQGGYQQQQGGYGQQQQQGGYQQQQQGGPNQQELWNWFSAVDIDRSGRISVNELQRALVNGDWTPFSYETVRLLLNMFDKDQTGQIEFNEFCGLWGYINTWRGIFQNYDRDRSGQIDGKELHGALSGFGFQVNDQLIRLIVRKYDQQGRGSITFDSFIQACVTVKTLTEAFRRLDSNNSGQVTLKYNEFLELFIANK